MGRLKESVSTPARAAPPRPVRRLDRKLSHIAAGRYTPDDFVIADAKDADMAFGLTAAGPVTGAPAARPARPRPAGTGPAANTSTQCAPWSLRANSTSC